MARYQARFAFDANYLSDAKTFARQLRSELRDSDADLTGRNVKLLKVTEPDGSDEAEDGAVTATPAVAGPSVALASSIVVCGLRVAYGPQGFSIQPA